MFSFRTTPLDEQQDLVLHKGNLGVLCNQAAWNPQKGEYLFETLYRGGNLKRVFTPEGWDFDELGFEGCEFISLDLKDPFSVTVDMLDGIDALVVEFQDVGSRYDSFTALLFALFQTLHHSGMSLSVYILDRENPCGRGVEGTILYPESLSSEGMGVEGVPHRHGLTLGELSNLFYCEIGAKFPLHIISYMVRSATQLMMPWSIPPFEDVPGLFTSYFYCGQVLLRGTNVSYGEGTTRPYEVYGAPYMKSMIHSPVEDGGVFCRWTEFTPQYGVYKGENCFGFQLLPNPGAPYHSLAHTLRILRAIRDTFPTEFKYDTLDQMIGDDVLFHYVIGSVDWEEVREHIKVEEQKWIRKAKRYMLYDDPLVRVKISQ